MLFVEYVVKGFQIVGADEVNVLFDEKAFELWSIRCAPPTEKFPFIMSLLDYVAHLLQLVGWNRSLMTGIISDEMCCPKSLICPSRKI